MSKTNILRLKIILAISEILLIIVFFCFAYFIYTHFMAPYTGAPSILSVIDETSNVDNTDNVDISDRIELVSCNLEDASTELSNIQKELEVRIEYVESLKKEAEIAENVISLSNEQVNAIQAKLNQELKASNDKSFFQSISISTFFFLLGLIVQPILKAIKNRFREKY